MQWLKQSTAATVKLGPFLADTDGKTAETGLTISQADVRLSKNGGNYAQKNESSASTHDELGEYDCDLDTTDTGTLGRLRVMVQESGALPVWRDFMVVPANVYDSLVGGSDTLNADVTQLGGSAVQQSGGYIKVSSGTGTGQLSLSNGVVLCDVDSIDGTELVATAGQIAAAFVKFFNVSTPTGTINSIPDAVAGAAGGLFVAGSNAATSITTALTANIVGNITGALSGSVATVTDKAGYSLAADQSGVTIGTVTTNTDMVSEPLDAAGIRTALGMAAADLDTQLDAILAASGSALTDAQSAIVTSLGTIRVARLNRLTQQAGDR
jgi:hypothetical protein